MLVALLAVLGAPPPPRSAGQAPDTAAAVAALAELRDACSADAGSLWGASLCGPVVLVDRASRTAVANQPDSAGSFVPRDGAFVGTLPPRIEIANTAVQWGGKRWAVVALPLPRDRFERIELLVHESFHREQPGLGLSGSGPASPHLDARNGRVWLRLELRALAAALRSSGGAARAHTRDALLFRARRHRLYPGADTLEDALEMLEGLPEYTGARFALAATGLQADRVARQLAEFEARPTYVRSFAYATGPALGLLLDRYVPVWRSGVRAVRSPAQLLSRAMRFDLPDRDAESRARMYRYRELAAAEDARDIARRSREAGYRARLVDGPVLLFNQHDLGLSFDPNTLVPLGAAGTVYPTGTFTAAWGRLVVTDGGALVSADFTTLSVAAPAVLDTLRQVLGPGWTLELAPGWVVRVSDRRAGQFEVAPAGH